jgi:hypothetical protein
MFENQVPHKHADHFHIRDFALRNDGKGGKRTMMVHKQMQFDGPPLFVMGFSGRNLSITVLFEGLFFFKT